MKMTRVSYYEADPKRLEQLKRDMLDAHDELVDRGVFPSLKKIRGLLPYRVDERLATDMRRRLIEDGDLPPTLRGNPKAVENGEKKMSCKVSKEEIDAAKAQILAEDIEKKLKTNLPAVVIVPLDQRTAVQVASWAIARYRSAWKNIRGVCSTTGPLLRTKTAHHPVYAGSGTDVF